MSKEIYISKFGYLTPEELEKKLEEVSDSYSEQLKAVGRWTVHLESAKQGALKLGELLGELIEAKAKLDLEEKMLVAKIEHWVKNGYFEQLETTIIEDILEISINGGTVTIITEREVRTIKAVFRATVKDDRREP